MLELLMQMKIKTLKLIHNIISPINFTYLKTKKPTNKLVFLFFDYSILIELIF
jgi:hypothetical protein